MEPSPTAPASTRRPLVVIAALLGLAIVGTIVASALAGRVTYEPGTPQAAVQGFVQALIDDDPATALAWTDPAQRCTIADLSVARHDGVTARIHETSTAGDTATVVVDFTESDGDPFGSEWSHRESFELARSDGEWRVASTSWLYVRCLR